MNAIISSSLKMTSLEIAGLVEKRHDNVKRTIETIAEKGIIVLPQIEDVPFVDESGRKRTTNAYIFTGEQGKRDSIVVVAQLSPKFTARLVDRWQALESGTAVPSFQLETQAKQSRAPAPRHIDPIIARARQADALMSTYLKIGKMLGTDTPTARTIAVDRVREEIGMDFSPLLINNQVEEVPMIPTNLGKEIGVNARKMNDILSNNGMVEKDEHGEWVPTEKGKPYCTVHPFKSPHSEHVGYRILWYRRVLDVLDHNQEDAA